MVVVVVVQGDWGIQKGSHMKRAARMDPGLEKRSSTEQNTRPQ